MRVVVAFTVTAMLLVLSAGCAVKTGKEEASEVKRLVAQIDSEADDALHHMVELGIELQDALVPSEVFYGSFTFAGADEFLILYKWSEQATHGAGYDRTIAAVYDKETYTLRAQNSFIGDLVSVNVFLSEEDNRSRVFVLCETESCGAWVQTQEQYVVEAGLWRAEQLDGSWWKPYSYDVDLHKESFVFCVPSRKNGNYLVFTVSGVLCDDSTVNYDLDEKGRISWDSSTGDFKFVAAPQE